MARNYSSVAEPKTLTTDVGSSDVQITLNNVTGLPSAPYVLILNPDTDKEEAVLVTVDQDGVTSPTLKVQRAIEASGGFGGAQTHSVGNVVKHMIVGSDLQIVHDHFSDDNTTTGTAHGATGGVVGRTNSQTLTNKTLTAPTITNPTISGTITGAIVTSANIVDGTIVNADISASAAIAASKLSGVVTPAGAQTLTDKTLTNPAITSPAITGGTLNGGNALTVTSTELNRLDGLTATASELNKLDGATVTVAELNALATLTASRAVVTDASGNLDSSAVTATELSRLDGVTSAIQTQLNDRLETSRTGAKVFIQTSEPSSGFSTYDIWIDY
jgi:hypothetical protein